MAKSDAAAELARARWKKTTTEERSEHARVMNEARWRDADDAKRKEIGKRLAESRAKARRRRKKPKS